MHDTTEELFAAALSLPSNERDSYLTRACGTDHAQLERVHSLLADALRSAEFMNESDATVRLSDGSNRIDNYHLLQELGEGGCGTVYLAEQTMPIRREVAIKIIKLGMDTKAVVARFEAERQALALMDHPNIARVLDAGATQTGRPYFVMEVVRGIRITEYCHQCRLTVVERIELFVQICSAVQHAHVKGVIHRDLKPSNILVTLDNGVPIVKVIDFGIAKAMHGRLSDQLERTLADQFIGTPAYVSPEQTEALADLDARSDIYSLGALLYELLTGSTPIHETELSDCTLAGLKDRIKTETPDRPSTRLERLNATAGQDNGAKLAKLLRGELDWIVMRCLEKDRARRYQHVNDLTDELRRFLRKEPVTARPPSLLYSLSKLAERHRTFFVACTIAVSALSAATAISTWQAIRATRAEQLSQRAIASLVDFIASADPFTGHGGRFNPDEMLDQASRTAHEQLDRYPDVQASLLEAIGGVLRKRGRERSSLEHLERAVQIRRAHTASGLTLASSLLELEMSVREVGDRARAERILDEVDSLIRLEGADRSMHNVRHLQERGLLAFTRGRIPEARADLRRSIEIAEAISGPKSLEIADSLTSLSVTYQWTDDFELSEQLLRESLAMFDQMAAPLHPDRVRAETELGHLMLYRGQHDEAIGLLEAALIKQVALFGPQSSQLASVHESLSGARKFQGRFADAERHVREAIRIVLLTEATSRQMFGYYRTSLAFILLEQMRYEEARSELEAALEIYSAILPSDHLYIASAEYGLAEALLACNKLEAAERMIITSINRAARSSPTPWRIARAESALGEALYRQGRKAEGERYILDSYPQLANAPGVDTFARDRARQRVIKLYKEQGRGAELAEFLAKYPDPQAPGARQLVTEREQSAATTS